MTAGSLLLSVAALLVARADALVLRPMGVPTRSLSTVAARPAVFLTAIEDSPGDKATDRQIDLVERASDPFRVVRVVVYATFGVAGLAGVGIALFQMGKDPGAAIENLAINAAVLGAGVGVFIFDRKVTADLRAKAEAEIKNPYLKGDALFEDDETQE